MSRRRKLAYWLAIDAAVAVIIMSLLLNKPSIYKPAAIDISAMRSGEIHPYFNQISSRFYNGAQSQEPFELVIDDRKLSEAIANWSENQNRVALYAPAVVFEEDRIVAMATADVEGVDMVVSVALKPVIDEQDRLKLEVDKVKVGSMWLTTVAKMTAERMYSEHTAVNEIDQTHWRAQLAAALLAGQSFEPVLTAEDKKVRVDRVSVEPGKLRIHFIPASARP